MEQSCPSCREPNPAHARFCLACGAPFEELATQAEERKVVSVLFVDLVGFTNRSDRADPEDVRATLRPYHARVKREIERFGGTVEKFVGDGVMAVFGAPVAHEDDPERAIRAALRIVDAIQELNDEQVDLELALRGAVGTGEAVVALGARPELGEGIVAGDVVNTTSRLQGVAPVGSVVVDEATMRATGGLIEFEALPAASLKGKAEPVEVWRVAGARSRFGTDVEPKARTPLIGRGHELALLRETYLRTLQESSVQLVTITGDAGVGKTRLVTELREFIDDREELVLWRQGRCLPYGDGIAYWALGEIVKAHAGILESDGPDEAAAKLGRAIDSLGAPDADWLRANLAPLIGLAGTQGERAETFAAWRQFLEAVAAQRPLVLLIEDLHWADPALLEFVEHLAEWSADVPILALCTARPELFDRAPTWGGGRRNATTIGLGPLSGEETAHLLAALLQRAVLPAETQTMLLERAGGNPLYAEQFARMLAERGDDQLPVPETVQALIAARLDTLTPDRKSVIQDAAVVGKVFWAGQLAAIGERADSEVAGALRDLVRRELVRPARISSIEGEQEFSFWHALVRDVAYQQIPRGARAKKHLRAADWVERTAGDRVADRADILAHHYERALELSTAANDSETAAALREPLWRSLVHAAERNRDLDAPRALEQLRRALELIDDEGERVRTLLLATNLAHVVDFSAAEPLAREALDRARATGDLLATGHALSELARIAWAHGRGAESDALVDESIKLLEREPPSYELAVAYMRKAGSTMLANDVTTGLEVSERALQLAREHASSREAFMALQARGMARLGLGDVEGGLADFREGLEVASQGGSARGGGIARNNLADAYAYFVGLRESLAQYEDGIAVAERKGVTGIVMWGRCERARVLMDLGRWDEALSELNMILADESRRKSQLGVIAFPRQLVMLAYRGRARDVAADVAGLPAQARDAADPQALVPALTALALLAHVSGGSETALGYVREVEEATRTPAPLTRLLEAPQLIRIALAQGEPTLAARFLDREARGLWFENAAASGRALLAEARASSDAGELFRDAAARWDAHGVVLETAHALLGVARTTGDEDARRRADELFASVGALVDERGSPQALRARGAARGASGASSQRA